MAQHRPKIGRKIKNKLRGDAGNKCANPGCANLRTHIHHINEWAVYQTHDEKDMIAICPSCHDHVHHGRLEISDETLYQWKSVKRQGNSNHGRLHVERGNACKLLLGSMAFSGNGGVAPFTLSPESYVSIEVEDEIITLVDLRLTTVRGLELVRIRRSGHYDVAQHQDVDVQQRAGAIKITVPCSPEYVPWWLIWAIHAQDQTFIKDRVTIFEVEVAKPGLVRVAGVWAHGNRAVRITRDSIDFYIEGIGKRISFVGQGEDSELHLVRGFLEGVPLFRF